MRGALSFEERRLHALPDVDASFEQRLQQPPGAAAFAHVQRRGRMAAGGIGAMLLLQQIDEQFVLVQFGARERGAQLGTGNPGALHILQSHGSLDVGQRFAEIASVALDGREVPEGVRLAVPLADIAPNRQRLAESRQRLVMMSEPIGGAADAVERRADPGQVVNLPSDRQRLPVILERLAVVAERVIVEANRIQCPGFPFVESEPA